MFGLVPAWQPRAALAGELAGSALGGLDDRRAARLVVSEIALALVLLVGAGLLLRALWRLERSTPDSTAGGVLAAHIDLPESRYQEAALPDGLPPCPLGLARRSACAPPWSARSRCPATRSTTTSSSRAGRRSRPGDEPSLYSRSVMGDYFGTMRIPLRTPGAS